ncbi:hypothetical protein TNCV_3903431 [Trichonephila clavipes]|nr:hypothetical protein TNCV_3903431 [Trichonephila clavipes]
MDRWVTIPFTDESWLSPTSASCCTNLSKDHLYSNVREIDHYGSIEILNGRGSRVVKGSDRRLSGHEFQPSTTKDPPCRAAMHAKPVES